MLLLLLQFALLLGPVAMPLPLGEQGNPSNSTPAADTTGLLTRPGKQSQPQPNAIAESAKPTAESKADAADWIYEGGYLDANLEWTSILERAPTWKHFWPQYDSWGDNTCECIFVFGWAAILGVLLPALARPLLDRIARDPLSSDSDSETSEEREATVKNGAWSSCWGPETDIPDKRVDEFVATIATQSPDIPALLGDGGASLCYRELEQRIAHLASELTTKWGVRPGDRVGILVPKSFSELIVPLAVIRAGAAFCNLDTTSSGDAQALLCTLLQPKVVVCGEAALQGALPSGTQSLLVHLTGCCTTVPPQPSAGGGAQSRAAAAEGVTIESPAAVWFTSGTTGQPKGVVWPHRMLTHNNFCTAALLGLGEQDVMLVKSTNIWAAWEYEAFPALMSGAALRISRQGGNKDPKYMASLLNGLDGESGWPAPRPVTCATFTSQVLNIILDRLEIDFRDTAQQMAQQLRHIIQVGERCPAALGDRVASLLPHVVLHNMWGTTESACTIFSASGKDLAGHGSAEDPGAGLPAGRPEPNVLVRLLDEHRREVEPGMEGSIYVGGIVASGYLSRPDLTAERFIQDPLDSGLPMFDTGDVGVVDGHGQLQILGRRDRQLKLRGIRIEPEGVEVTLCKCPGVQRASVVATQDPAMLHAFVEACSDKLGSLAEEDVMDHCKSSLPVHMQPQTVTVLPPGGIPQLPNGKPNLKELESRAQARVNSSERPMVDSLGLLRMLSKDDVAVKRILDNVLVVSTFTMVHYHMNQSREAHVVISASWLWSVAMEWGQSSEFSTLGFILSGAVIDSLDRSQRLRFGARDAVLLYVYLSWGALPQLVNWMRMALSLEPLHLLSGPRWYLLMLLLCKLLLLGLHKLGVPLKQQLIIFLALPAALCLHLHVLAASKACSVFTFMFGDGRNNWLFDLVAVLNYCKMSDAGFFCAATLLSPSITKVLRELIARTNGIVGVVSALLTVYFIHLTIQLNLGWPSYEAQDMFILALVTVSVASLPEHVHFEFAAKNSLGAYVSSCAFNVLGARAWTLFGALGRAGPWCQLAGMLADVLLIMLVLGPATQWLLLLPWRLCGRAASSTSSTARMTTP